MPLSHTSNVNFNAGNFTSAAPAGGTFALQTLGIGNVSNVKWANKTRQINLGNNNYGYVTVDLSYTVTGTADTVGVSFYNPLYLITYNTSLSGLFKPIMPGQYVKLKPGVTTRLYIIVNYEDKKSPFVPLTISVGRKGTLPSNVTVNIGYDCTDVGVLYQYLVGMHAYSAYDALINPTLQTYLYSYTPIGSWTNNTEIYSKGNFTHPAYPYYYGYSGNVYKVGDELERSFGIKKYYEVTKRGIGKTKINNKIAGPKSWRDTNADGFTTENFVYPTMNNIGYLKQIIPSANLIQPSSYRYYLGAASTAQLAADFFTQYDFTNRVIHTIPGFSHAIAKLSTGFLDGYRGSLPSKVNIVAELITIGLSIVDALWGYDASAMRLGTVGSVINVLIKIDQFINFTAGGSLFLGAPGPGVAFAAIPIPIIAIVVAVAVVSLVIKLLTVTRIDVEEPSITFKYRYANTPYLNNGTRLYTNTGLTTYKSEYYCDGIYFYNQTAGTIANKELSYSTNALLSQDPLKKGLAYSSRADQPDSGSIITDLSKLIALPYCSGKPDTVSGTNKNTTQTATFTPLNKGGDLLTYPLTVTVEIPEGTITTTGSQALANAEAKALLNSLTSSYAASGSYGQLISGIGGFGSYFTHEIKVETYPNTGSVFFNNTDGAGLTVGKSLYYDNAGFLKVFNGYYAADSGSVAPYSHYRTFFKTSNGNVTDILSMASSGATTVTSLVNSVTYPVQTSNQGYTSDWYWYNSSYSDLNEEIYNITNANTNPNSLYATSSLKSGFILPNTSSFYNYDSISSTSSYSEAVAGFYYAFDSYEESYSFAYNTATTLSINLTEVCFTNYSIGEPYGVNISGATGSASSSFYYPVNMTLNAYNGGTLLASFPATASAEGVTYVDFPAPITKDSNVTNVTIASISSPNPNNKILYVAGSFTNCNPTTPAPTTAAPTTAAPTTAAPTTAAPTTAAPTTPAPTPLPCICWTIYNEGNTTGNYTIINCNGTESSPNLLPGNSRSHCLQGGTYPIINSGLLTDIECGDICNVSSDCTYCGPTPAPTNAPTTAAPTTAAPTNAPTTAAPTTAAPTVLITQLSGFVSIVDESAACAGGEYGDIRIDVTGTTICDATSIVYLPSSVWSDFIFNQEFYVSDRVSGVFKSRTFRRNGNNNTASPLLACNDCPTPAPTPNPTTAAPTAAPTTAAPTTPPTPPPTNPPTPAPTNPFGGLIYYSSISAFDVCNIATNTLSVSGNNGTFCTSTIFTSAGWTSLPTGTYWIKWIGDTKVVQVFHASNADNVGRVTGCNECPTPSPTAAPTTAAPTPNPTPNPTAAPTTASPTPNPTPSPTEAAPPFSFLVNNLGRASFGLACVTAKTRTIYAYDSDFSLVDRFYSTNTFPYTPFNGGNAWFSDGVNAVAINSSGYVIENAVCPTPSPTAAPTTAAPTNPPTPPPTPSPTTPPTPPPTNPPTPPPTPPPTTPPTPPPTPPPTTPPTPPPTPPPTIAYYYYEVTPCFSGGNFIARSLSIDLDGVYAANGTCYIIQGLSFPQAYDFDIDAGNYQGGSCYVSGCGYNPPPPPPADTYSCDPIFGCYLDTFSPDSYALCVQFCFPY